MVWEDDKIDLNFGYCSNRELPIIQNIVVCTMVHHWLNWVCGEKYFYKGMDVNILQKKIYIYEGWMVVGNGSGASP